MSSSLLCAKTQDIHTDRKNHKLISMLSKLTSRFASSCFYFLSSLSLRDSLIIIYKYGIHLLRSKRTETFGPSFLAN